MILELSKTYVTRDGVGMASRIDSDVFVKRYFTYCLQCNFCHDVCCSHGATVDIENVARLEQIAPQLEAAIGVPRDQWFTGEYTLDKHYAGGQYTRTQVRDGRCVFLNKDQRGCSIHTYCLENNLDYHDLKPSVCWQWPIFFENGLLFPAIEVREGELICLHQGPTLYQASRSELNYYFGSELVAELDVFQQQIAGLSNSA